MQQATLKKKLILQKKNEHVWPFVATYDNPTPIPHAASVFEPGKQMKHSPK